MRDRRAWLAVAYSGRPLEEIPITGPSACWTTPCATARITELAGEYLRLAHVGATVVIAKYYCRTLHSVSGATAERRAESAGHRHFVDAANAVAGLRQRADGLRVESPLRRYRAG